MSFLHDQMTSAADDIPHSETIRFLLQKCKESRQIKIDNGLAQLDSRPIVVMKYLFFIGFIGFTVLLYSAESYWLFRVKPSQAAFGFCSRRAANI
jgi:hypothetical protein